MLPHRGGPKMKEKEMREGITVFKMKDKLVTDTTFACFLVCV